MRIVNAKFNCSIPKAAVSEKIIKMLNNNNVKIEIQYFDGVEYFSFSIDKKHDCSNDVFMNIGLAFKEILNSPNNLIHDELIIEGVYVATAESIDDFLNSYSCFVLRVTKEGVQLGNNAVLLEMLQKEIPTERNTIEKTRHEC